MDFDPILYIVQQLTDWWEFLWNFHPFPGSGIFDFSLAALLIGFSCIAIVLEYFNDDGNSDDNE